MEDDRKLSEVADKPDISAVVSRLAKQPAPTVKGPVREINPVVFFDRLDPDAEENIYDFRPVDESEGQVEELVTPKVLSAQELADSFGLEEDSNLETPVPAEKDSGEPKEQSTGTPTS